jgi:hypothetical protein
MSLETNLLFVNITCTLLLIFYRLVSSITILDFDNVVTDSKCQFYINISDIHACMIYFGIIMLHKMLYRHMHKIILLLSVSSQLLLFTLTIILKYINIDIDLITFVVAPMIIGDIFIFCDIVLLLKATYLIDTVINSESSNMILSKDIPPPKYNLNI